jgi:hypothetical protein
MKINKTKGNNKTLMNTSILLESDGIATAEEMTETPSDPCSEQEPETESPLIMRSEPCVRIKSSVKIHPKPFLKNEHDVSLQIWHAYFKFFNEPTKSSPFQCSLLFRRLAADSYGLQVDTNPFNSFILKDVKDFDEIEKKVYDSALKRGKSEIQARLEATMVYFWNTEKFSFSSMSSVKEVYKMIVSRLLEGKQLDSEYHLEPYSVGSPLRSDSGIIDIDLEIPE